MRSMMHDQQLAPSRHVVGSSVGLMAVPGFTAALVDNPGWAVGLGQFTPTERRGSSRRSGTGQPAHSVAFISLPANADSAKRLA